MTLRADVFQRPLVAWAAALQQMWLAVCEPEELRVTPEDLPPATAEDVEPER